MANNSGSGFFLMVGLIVAAWLIGSSFEEAKKIDNARFNTIRVKGYAQKDIESDLIEWSCQIKSKSPSLQEAYRILGNYKSRTLEFLKSMGISESSIVSSIVNKQEVYKEKKDGYGNTNEIIAYQLYQSFSISSNDLDKIEKISRATSDLISEGINIQSYNPSYYYTKIEDLKLEMLGEASQNALERAEKLAGNTDGSVGSLVNASQGVFQITSQNSTEFSDYGSFDTFSRLKTIKAVITAEFSVE